MSELRITYRKSAIGYAHDQKATIAALGLRRLNQTVAHQDTPALRGMLHKVRHLVSVDGIPADSPGGMARLASPAEGGDGAAAAPAPAGTRQVGSRGARR
jgi:large subunit ribosomal protein L30